MLIKTSLFWPLKFSRLYKTIGYNIRPLIPSNSAGPESDVLSGFYCTCKKAIDNAIKNTQFFFPGRFLRISIFISRSVLMKVFVDPFRGLKLASCRRGRLFAFVAVIIFFFCVVDVEISTKDSTVNEVTRVKNKIKSLPSPSSRKICYLLTLSYHKLIFLFLQTA